MILQSFCLAEDADPIKWSSMDQYNIFVMTLCFVKFLVRV